MSYIQVTFTIEPPSPGSEIMMALLSEFGYDSFEETGKGLNAYIVKENFQSSLIEQLINDKAFDFSVSFSYSGLPDKNWNEVWESSYQPITVRDVIYVRAPFHQEKDAKYQLLIEPKMSFGTGHHETTSLMMEAMLDEDLAGKTVLDMGCGTGILAILSEILGAGQVLAIDNDPNACDNALENIRRNKCKRVNVHIGDSGILKGNFDFILANINRNILLHDMAAYAKHLLTGGTLLMSGFYRDDLDAIIEESQKYGLTFDRFSEKNHWVVATFTKR